jgi:hypothetical protein
MSSATVAAAPGRHGIALAVGHADAMSSAGAAGRRLGAVAVLAAAAMGFTSCSDGSDGEASTTQGPDTTASTSTTTPPTSAPAPPDSAVLLEEVAVGAAYRQGVARAEGGWLFSTNLALYLVDESLERTLEDTSAIPDELAAQGYDHIGDADITDGIIYVPLEQPDKDVGQQLMVEYDATTLEFIRSVPVAQAHNSFVSVADDIAYSISEFDGDDTVVRYDAGTWEPLEPLVMSRSLDRIQGGDVLDGYLWLSADDEVDGIYRVSLADGTVEQVGALAHVDGEGEGIDATALPSGDLHALSIDAALAPVWFQHFALEGGG